MKEQLKLDNGKYVVYNLDKETLEELQAKLKEKGLQSRADYMNDLISHDDFYAQFVSSSTIENVKRFIGIDNIKASTCEHFNDIPLKNWDRLPKICSKELLDLCGETYTMATHVCIMKNAARQIKKGL